MIFLKIVFGLAIGVFIYLAGLSFYTRNTVNISQGLDSLIPCPDKPNCVSSEAPSQQHQIDAYKIIGNDPGQSWERLMSAITRAGGAIKVEDGQYCHAVFTSTIFRFKDDLEVMLKNNLIAVRSASRAGTSDLGQNRKRVEKIRQLYADEP